jgi:glutamate dehydrogenase (NAD(P)+)
MSGDGVVHGHVLDVPGPCRERNRHRKPVAVGGTEGRRQATGYGVAYLASRACEQLGIHLDRATAIVQGFGNVGSYTANTLHNRYGVKIVGVSDHTAAYYDPKGLPLPEINRFVEQHGVLTGFSSECRIDADEFLTCPCDILVPAAIERVITEANAAQLQCHVLAEGASGCRICSGSSGARSRC